ncbi:hypothetical protein [Actinosynnema sp. NPDC020468]|uniref:hypothetical protein n=1 Tax=Actinosynnema sp. NPDC020468 TaxID=3154488 RepID=UPI0033C34A3B
MTIACTDAFGRKRTLTVAVTQAGITVHTPPGEVAALDWFELDQLRQALATLRPHLPGTRGPA